MEKFSLKLPGFGKITPPPNVPSGNLETRGQDIIRVGITLFLIIIVLLALLYILWGGIRYITSHGDKQQIEGARDKIIHAVYGLIIAFFAFLIINTTGQFFNVNLIGQIALGPTPTPTCGGIGASCTTGTQCCSNLCIDFLCAAPVSTPTPTPTPVVVCSLTSILSISCPATVQAGNNFLIDYTFKDAGLNSPFKWEHIWLERNDIGYTGNCLINQHQNDCKVKPGTPFSVIAPVTAGNYKYTIHGYAHKEIDADYICGKLTDGGDGLTQSCTIPVVAAPTPTSTPVPPTPTPTPCAGAGKSCEPGIGLPCCPGLVCVGGTFCKAPTPTPTPTPTLPPHPPDLVIYEGAIPFDYTPKPATSGEDITFKFEVANVGEGTSPATTARLYESVAKPICNQAGWFGEVPIISLIPFTKDPDKNFTKVGGFAAPGTYTVWVFVDGKCEIIESDETNNTQSILVTVN